MERVGRWVERRRAMKDTVPLHSRCGGNSSPQLTNNGKTHPISTNPQTLIALTSYDYQARPVPANEKVAHSVLIELEGLVYVG